MIQMTTFAGCALAVLSVFLVSDATVVAAQDCVSSPSNCEQSASGQPEQQKPPQPASGQQTKPRSQGTQPATRDERERAPAGRLVNVMIEVTITEQVESEPAQTKTVSMIVADRAQGRVRAMAIAQSRDAQGAAPVRLNVDAFPELRANGTIRLLLTLEYEALLPVAGTDVPRRTSTLNEMLTVIMQPGKPLTVSRAVDPLTNRRTSVEVTASIAK